MYFPKIEISMCTNGDSSIERNVSNTAQLLGWLYCQNEFIWKWEFKELTKRVSTEIFDDRLTD